MKTIKIILIFIVVFPVCVLGQCLTFTITTTPSSCFGCCDGSINITNLTGGCPPYQYTWSGNSGGIVSGACSGITYTLTIKDAGCCPDTTTQIQVPNSTTDINQISSNKMRLNIYPNPTNDNFIVETNSTEKQIVQIFDVAGKMVLSQNVNGKTNIDISILSEGVYNISLINREGVVNKRLIIGK